MTFRRANGKFVIGSSLLMFLMNVTNGQTLPDTLFTSGSAPVFAPCDPDTLADSLQLQILDQEIALAMIEERQTSFWFRCIPDIRFSANVGVQQLAFVDPSTFTPYVLPKDAYRLSLGLSLSDLFDFDKHTTAEIRREKLETQRQLMLRSLQKSNEKARCALQHDLLALREQEKLIDELVRYTEILFDQGEVKFGELIRVRLQQLHIRQSLNRLLLQTQNQTP